MVRPRKSALKPPNRNGNGSSSSSSSESTESRGFKLLSMWKTLVGVICLLIAVYAGSIGYLETRVNTLFSDEKIIKAVDPLQPHEIIDADRYWGSYRPGVYFGLKTREPKSPVFGLMWYEPTTAHKGVRHWCEQRDNLASFGWDRHDGVTFGEQTIVDTPHTLTTSFVKTPGGNHGGTWTARVDVQSKGNSSHPFTLLWYAALDGAGRVRGAGGALRGYTPQLRGFRCTLHPLEGRGKLIHTSMTEASASGLDQLKEKIYSVLRAERHPQLGKIAVLGPDPDVLEGAEVNFVAIQMLVNTPFTLDIVYSEDSRAAALPSGGHGAAYTRALEHSKRKFDEEFEKQFGLSAKGYSPEDIAIARAALSNMLGGIGYFYGSGRVQSQYTKEPVPYWRAPLYTGVPSRSFFPRGFLWDEGFHGLLIGKWSPEIEMDIVAHWMDLINVEGWIPREQILGAEALARVPKEFVVQSNTAGNPPMLLVQLARLVTSRPELFRPGAAMRNLLDRMYTRLQAWFSWFHTTQRGEEPTTYRWRGRVDDGLQLNPKTLTSGLDDYPRASHPTDSERHVDLRCWMFAAADAMATIALVLQRDVDKYEVIREQLADEELLNELHWSPETGSYADYGLHTDGVKLVRQSAKSVRPPDQPRFVRSVTSPPQYQLVTSAFGYVSLFPMLLKVLRPSSEGLGRILQDLDKPELLWSNYGLRSLSKSSPTYMKRNTEHDPPYWRGQVWVNVNYLALSALKHYSEAAGPYRERAGRLHSALRANLVGNILSQYKRTGYLWEQYSSDDGRGSGCKPFTGWTALVVLIMAEDY